MSDPPRKVIRRPVPTPAAPREQPIQVVIPAELPEPKVYPGHPKMAKEFEFILTGIYTCPNPHLEWKRLEDALTIGQRRGDRATLQEALDSAEDNARKAHKLYLNALLEQEAYEIQADTVLAALVSKATAELQIEKDRGERSKQITEADVRLKAAELFPDEWEAQALRRSKAKGMVKALEKLSKLWEMRCHTLAGMLSSLRG